MMKFPKIIDLQHAKGHETPDRGLPFSTREGIVEGPLGEVANHNRGWAVRLRQADGTMRTVEVVNGPLKARAMLAALTRELAKERPDLLAMHSSPTAQPLGASPSTTTTTTTINSRPASRQKAA